MKRPFLAKFFSVFSLVFCCCLFVFFLGRAQAEFSPAGIKTLATLKGQWTFKTPYFSPNNTELPRAPAVNFISGYNNILISFDGKLPPHVQDSVNIALSDTYFGCNGENFRLWFSNGEYIPLEVGRCEHGRVYLHIPIGEGIGIWASYYRLAELIQQGARPVLLSEGENGIKLSYPSDAALKSFRDATNPQTNGAYFEAIKNYWAAFEHKHSIDVLDRKQFIPMNTEVIGSLKGKWQLKEDAGLFPGDLPAPTVLFKAGPMLVVISVASQENDYLNGKDIIVRDFLHMNLCSLYFKCNAGPVKLWFDNGEYVETGSAFCLGDNISATSSKGQPTAKEAEEERKLDRLIKTHRPVALSQGKYAVSLDYHDSTALDLFRKKSTPSENPDYFQKKKKFYQEKKATKK